jgi:hypothetical protein
VPAPYACLQEDLILPHHYTFHELIQNKARGKSGPLFEFGVHEDVRIVNDASGAPGGGGRRGSALRCAIPPGWCMRLQACAGRG